MVFWIAIFAGDLGQIFFNGSVLIFSEISIFDDSDILDSDG